nr:MATE family efflux transporter [Corynebacterium capitovis]
MSLPALGVLAANPLYLLLDTAVVGSLGPAQLAALAAGAAVQSTVTTQLTFLSYGTTARAARLYGMGKRDAAVEEGVQASWVALFVGIALSLVVVLWARPLAGIFTTDEYTAREAANWMLVAAGAIPLTLLVMAGNGWMRGVHNTGLPFRLTLCGLIPGALALPVFVGKFGLVGSAYANLLGMGLAAVPFVAVLIREHGRGGGSWAPRWSVIRSQLLLGRDLVLRSLSFQVSFLAAAAVAGRAGVAVLAAHQVLLQIWNFLTLVLDSLAIAAQTLTGAALGAGRVGQAREFGAYATRLCTVLAVVLALIFAVLAGPIQKIFTRDSAVLAELSMPWWLMVAMILVGGVVFALDGVLLGAGDAVFLRNLTAGGVIGAFLPLIAVSWVAGWGLTGIWVGHLMSLVVRAAGDGWRFRSSRWARQGSMT